MTKLRPLNLWISVWIAAAAWLLRRPAFKVCLMRSLASFSVAWLQQLTHSPSKRNASRWSLHGTKEQTYRRTCTFVVKNLTRNLPAHISAMSIAYVPNTDTRWRTPSCADLFKIWFILCCDLWRLPFGALYASDWLAYLDVKLGSEQTSST